MSNPSDITRPSQRHDGWTAERQKLFLDRLADSGSVEHAADAAGMSASSAYRLRRRPDAAAFRAAWEQALLEIAEQVEQVALSRLFNGERRQEQRGGLFIEHSRECSDRLLIYMLERTARRRSARYANEEGWQRQCARLDTAALGRLADARDAVDDQPDTTRDDDRIILAVASSSVGKIASSD